MPEGDFTGDAGLAPEANGDEAALGQPNKGMPRWARERIDELTRARRDAERQAESERTERQTLAAQVAQLTQQIQQATGQTKPRSWDDLGGDDLHRLVADELARLTSPVKNDETGEVTSQADPNLLAKGIRELIRKEIEQRVTAEKKSAAVQTEAGQRIEAMRAQIHKDFGADALNPGSELRQRAEQHWKSLEAKFGKDGLAKRLAETPDLEYLCFKSAAADLFMEGKAQSPQTARELEIARRQAGVGSGGEGMAEANTRFSTLLKKNDLDSAASELARQMMGGQQ